MKSSRFDALFNRSLVPANIKEKSKFRISGPMWRESSGGFTHKVPVMRKAFPCHDIVMWCFDINFSLLHFFFRKHKIIYYLSALRRLARSDYSLDVVAVDALATQEARTLIGIIFTQLSWNITAFKLWYQGGWPINRLVPKGLWPINRLAQRGYLPLAPSHKQPGGPSAAGLQANCL